MPGLSRLLLLLPISLASLAFGRVVSRDLRIVNANLSPDGFTRS